MYRLLIVDDEEIIVNGLYEIFLGIEKLELDVYRAYSVDEAIFWLAKTRIDIILTDINMPETDGLQLMEEIFINWPQCKVIFLTGHSEFEYVYKAIQHPGVSFILKTESIEKIIGKVEEAIQKLQDEIKTKDLIRSAKEQIHTAIDMFQKDFFLRVLKGDHRIQVTNRQFKHLSARMNAEWPVILVLGSADGFPGQVDYMQIMQRLYSVRQVIGKYLADHVNNVIILDEHYCLALFIQPAAALQPAGSAEERQIHYQKTLSFLRGILEAIQTTCQKNLGISVSFSIGSEPCPWQDIAAKYFLLNHLLNYRIGAAEGTLLVEGEIYNGIRNEAAAMDTHEKDTDIDALKAILEQKNLSPMEQYLEAGQQPLYFEAMDNLLGHLKNIGSRNNTIALETYYTISLSLLSYINRWKLNEKVAFFIGQSELTRTDRFSSWDEAALYLRRLSEVLFNIQKKEQKKRADKTISHLQNFIAGHLDEDLSLVRLADQVYLNPSYLSRIYKQETGANLSEFIENARLAKAKELLRNEKIKIGDIAKQVGYDSAASFTRFFKKLTGASPQEFREKCLWGCR